jgi:hypothetical protein
MRAIVGYRLVERLQHVQWTAQLNASGVHPALLLPKQDFRCLLIRQIVRYIVE